MINKIDTNSPQYTAYRAFKSNAQVKRGYMSYRYHNKEINTLSTKVNAGVGSVIGTLIPMLFFAKKQNNNIFKLTYGLKEMLAVTAGAVTGGVIGGIHGDLAKKSKREKINEGVFQFMNAAVPGTLVTGMIELSKKHKRINNIPAKIAGTAASVLVGVFGAAKLSNLICDPHDKVPDRKLTMKDAIANIDDALGALILAKFPCSDKLHIEKILPAIYAWCGYRAGQAN